MKKLLPLLLAVVPCIAQANDTVHTELNKHPRLKKAIDNIEDAIDYLQKAPDVFGGHKGDAIRDCKQASAALRKALQFAAKKDNEK